MRKALKLTMMALAALLMTSPAMAVTVSYSLLPLTPGLQPVSLPITAPVFSNVIGDSPFYADVWAGTACDTSCPFNAVGAGGSATYVTGDLGSLAIMWGSPDSFPASTIDWNKIEFWKDGSPFYSLVGDVVAAAYVGLGGISGTGFVTVLFDDIEYDQIVLTATRYAFEHAFSARGFEVGPVVPIPAGFVLLLTGLMGLGFLGRSRAKAA